MVPSQTPVPSDSAIDRYFWTRHANPKSGWSRALAFPVLVACLYARRWRGVVLALVFLVLNPFLFSPPEHNDAWMTRVVLAERRWAETDREWLAYPEVLNLLNLGVTAYVVYAAVRRRPAETGLATALSMSLKFWFVAELVHRYDAGDSDGELSYQEQTADWDAESGPV